MDNEAYTYIVIDDRADVREMVKGAFSELGCECVGEAADGPSGADLYFEEFPDFVLLDIDIPETERFDTLKEILEDDPEAFVVMLSVVGQQSEVIEAMKHGAVDFLTKPLSMPIVREKFQEWI